MAETGRPVLTKNLKRHERFIIYFRRHYCGKFHYLCWNQFGSTNGKPKLLMITIDQIQVGTHILISMGEIQTRIQVDLIFDYKGFTMVETSVAGGIKGAHRTEINSLVEYLNEAGAKLIN